MKIRVLMFASLAQATGCREMEFDLPEAATVGDALTALQQRYPAAAALGERLAAAVNLNYARRDHVLKDGDELALIPPVSGG